MRLSPPTGDWLLYLMHYRRSIEETDGSLDAPAPAPSAPSASWVERWHMTNFLFNFVMANVIGFLSFFSIGGFIHVRRKSGNLRRNSSRLARDSHLTRT